jgi:3-hydroxymyristoyl/3-hydroxydecanoyl-(acyl carrier protein) dehydratase
MPVMRELSLDPELQSLTCHFMVPRDLPVFSGHFPGLPVVPGIMQVGWAAELAREHALVTGRCTGMVTAKFRRLLLPGMQIDASLDGGSRSGQLQFRFQCGGEVVSIGRLQFGGSGG